MFSRQQRAIADGNTKPFFPINRGFTSGHYTGAWSFSVMFQNDTQAVDSDRSTFVKFADDLTLSFMVKGTQD